MRLGVGQPPSGLEALGDDLVRRLAVEHALAAGVVGGVEAAQQPLEVPVGVHGDAEHLAGDPARSEEHTPELQSRQYIVCRLLLEKKNNDSLMPRHEIAA